MQKAGHHAQRRREKAGQRSVSGKLAEATRLVGLSEECMSILKLGSKHGLIYLWKQLLLLLCGERWEGANVSERDQLRDFYSRER